MLRNWREGVGSQGMVIVRGDLFKELDDPTKIYKVHKKTIEKYEDYMVAQCMEEIDEFKTRTTVKYDLSGSKKENKSNRKISHP